MNKKDIKQEFKVGKFLSELIVEALFKAIVINIIALSVFFGFYTLFNLI